MRVLSTEAFCFAPSSPIVLSRPFFRCVALLSGDYFYLELGVIVILSLGPTVALSFSFLLLCLLIGPNELGEKKSNENENLRGE